MGTALPLGDSSRRPQHRPVVTIALIAANAIVIIFIFVRVTFIPAAVLIGLWFLIQLVSLGTVATAQTGGVAYLAHIGGMLFGALLGRFFEDPRRIAAQRQ